MKIRVEIRVDCDVEFYYAECRGVPGTFARAKEWELAIAETLDRLANMYRKAAPKPVKEKRETKPKSIVEREPPTCVTIPVTHHRSVTMSCATGTGGWFGKAY